MKKLTLLIAMLMAIGGCSDTLEGKTSSSIICNGPQMLNEYGAVYHSIHYDLNLENAEMYMLDKNKEVLFSPGGNEARINPITDKELETAIALTGLKATVFERRLGMYEYHHGETKEYWIAKYDFEVFLNDNKELMHEYRVWLEDARV